MLPVYNIDHFHSPILSQSCFASWCVLSFFEKIEKYFLRENLDFQLKNAKLSKKISYLKDLIFKLRIKVLRPILEEKNTSQIFE